MIMCSVDFEDDCRNKVLKMVRAKIIAVCIPGSNLTQMQNQEMDKYLSLILSVMNFSIISARQQMHKLIIL